jgi:hypothetical protein
MNNVKEQLVTVLICLSHSLIDAIKRNPIHIKLPKLNLNQLDDKSALLEWNLPDFRVNFIFDSEDVKDNEILLIRRDENQDAQIDTFHFDCSNKEVLSKITDQIVRLILLEVNR